MLWLKPGDDNAPYYETTKPYAYHIDQFEQLSDVWLRVYDYAVAMGLDVIQGDHEDAPGQIELNFQYDYAIRTSDRLTTYRQICAQVAREFNLLAVFMSKPYMGMPANGCHHNVSLWRGGEDNVVSLVNGPLPGMEENFLYRSGGKNEFRDENEKWLPAQIGRWSLGGMIQHLNALVAISSSTVNSYRRLNDTGMWAPVGASWGLQNRSCAIRVSSPDRFEFRCVDSMVNPYLMQGALLKAFDDGIDNHLDPGEPEERNFVDAWRHVRHIRLVQAGRVEQVHLAGLGLGREDLPGLPAIGPFEEQRREPRHVSTVRSANGRFSPRWLCGR
jgi:glutamine synthetase